MLMPQNWVITLLDVQVRGQTRSVVFVDVDQAEQQLIFHGRGRQSELLLGFLCVLVVE
jgi:hypothetical protein